MNYDIFISYRRDDGEQTAKAIYDRLTDQGYKVFLDVEYLRSGAFNEKLYSVIDECHDVLVILSPNALKRCANEDDWVRLEVAHAIHCKKNIVPVILQGFDFPSELPDDIETLRFQNQIRASVEFFDAFMEKLSKFLQSKPGFIRKFFSGMSWRRSVIAVVACLLLLFGIWGGSMLIPRILPHPRNVYPGTQKQKNNVKDMLGYIFTNLGVADCMLSSYQDAIDASEDYLRDPASSSYQDLIGILEHERKELKKQSLQAIPLSKELSKAMSGTKVNTAELAAFPQYLNALFLQCDQDLVFLKDAMNPAKPLDNPARFRIVEIDRDLMALSSKELMVSTCQLVLPIDERALKEFRTEFLPELKIISKELPSWSRNKASLKAQEKNIITQQDGLMTEYSSRVGKMRMDLMSVKKRLQDLKNGSNRNAEKRIANSSADPPTDKKKEVAEKQKILEEKQKALAKAQKELDEKKQQIREKFTPKDSDGPYLVWGKALRFLRVRMYDDAVNAFQFYLNKVKDSDAEAPVYVPAAIDFVRSIGKTGIDYGVLVVGYEPGKPHHPVYKVGDIVVAINKTLCHNFTDYNNIIGSLPAGVSYTATLLRPDEKTGRLQMIDAEIPRSVGKVALMDLKEGD
ncbi:MAG TPA: hypothetical protein DDW65_07000 [Firmicutes bacterium]|jgi:hypothetical protein|nr:hypothetical protein [Bacillota bacterium]